MGKKRKTKNKQRKTVNDSSPQKSKPSESPKKLKKKGVTKTKILTWTSVGLISFLILLLSVAFFYGKFLATKEYDIVMKTMTSSIDQITGPLKKIVEPHVEKLKNKIIEQKTAIKNSKHFEPLLKILENTVEPVWKGFYDKVVEYKNAVDEFIPEDFWFSNKTIGFSVDVEAKHPVMIIPGHITTELEVWKGKECMPKFKTKVWGEIEMFLTFLKNKTCWIEHITLNKTNGLDPDGIKVRAKREAIDYLFPKFWVWGRVIEELAAIGYTSNNMYMAEYDWRLGFEGLEIRDAYFTRLQNSIELLYKIHGEKVVVITHSMGGALFFHFMNWVKSKKGGNSRCWCDTYIQSSINIGVPFLGVPKVIGAVLSGEMKDTVDLFFAERILDGILAKEGRTSIFRTWLSMLELFPKGPNNLWGPLLITDTNEEINMDNIQEFYKNNTDEDFSNILDKFYITELDKLEDNDDHKYWTNPFATQLPFAPDMSIYCFYGVGIPTEIGYRITKTNESGIPYKFDFTDSNEDGPVRFDEWGDGTVPYVSMSHTCNKIWREDKYNPSKINVLTKEYEHKPMENPLSKRFDLRGGGTSGNHVNIMGNEEMLTDILHIVSGHFDRVDERIIVNNP